MKSIESKEITRRPSAPFRTTTMQQEAGRKLGFTAQRAMSVAQSLYEDGFITYMRTDSVQLSDTAINAARNQVRQLFGPQYLPSSPRVYTSKVKNAQEAHEAIRPAGETFRTPAQTGLRGDEFRLYELIWMRTIASQMADAKLQRVTVQIDARPAAESGQPSCGFTSTGSTVTFPGFMKAYVESTDDSSADDESQRRIPQLTQGQSLRPDEVTASGHETRPPARYTEPSLVAKLEELEIGRPSTYASIIRTITSRDYVFKKGSALVPTWLAFAVTRLLEEHFPRLVDYAFTAEMEDVLDEIADGRAQRLSVLTDFYFGSPNADDPDAREGLQQLVSELGDIDARKLSTFPLGDLESDAEGSGIAVRVGRYGTYVEDAENRRANVADDLAPDELTVDLARELLSKPMGEERELGLDPETHTPIVARNGRFGPVRHRGARRGRPEEREGPYGVVVPVDEHRERHPGAGPAADESAARGRGRRGRPGDHLPERPLRPVPQEGNGFPLAGGRGPDLRRHPGRGQGDLRPAQAARPGSGQAAAARAR